MTHNSVAYRLAQRPNHRHVPLIKRADLGGDGRFIPFEQALSNLAHAYLKDKAPQLLDHELGFQLLEKNDDNNRAVGILGFKVGSQLMYVPIFFLHGEVRGHELLYLKDADTFIPLKENWINYVLQRKPNIIGTETYLTPSQLGISQPDFNAFRTSPHKYASAYPVWLQPGLPGLLHTLGNPTRPPLQVPNLVKNSADAAFHLLHLLDKYPQTARPILACYGPELIKTAINTAKDACSILAKSKKPVPKKRIHIGSIIKDDDKHVHAKDPIKTGALKIWRYSADMPAPKELTAKQAEQLKRDGVLIEDNRPEASVALRIDKPLSLQNPDETGFYDILTKTAEFEKCLYIQAPINADGRQEFGVLIAMDKPLRRWITAYPGNVFAASAYPKSDYQKWFDDLPDTNTFEKGNHYVVLTRDGQGSCVFEVGSAAPAAKGEKAYHVYWIGTHYAARPGYRPPVANTYYDYSGEAVPAIVFNRIKGKNLIIRNRILYVPPGAKVLPLKKNTGEHSLTDIPTVADSGSYDDILSPGNLTDVQIGILKLSGELKVHNDGCETVVNGKRMSPLDALVSLICDYGLREKAAKDILTEAQLRHGLRCRIKFAQPYNLVASAPTAPAFPEQPYTTDNVMGTGLPMTYPQESEIPVPELQGTATRPDMAAPPSQMLAQQIMQAANTGQQEVLDTALLNSLLRSTNDIDRYLPNLMKGLDSLGRLLFNLYWHRDEFAERYGDEKIPEIEDALRNSFEMLGDITLELKQKTIEPYPNEGIDVDFKSGT